MPVREFLKRGATLLLWCLLTVACGPVPEPEADFILKGGMVVTLDDQFQVFDPGYIAVAGDTIVAVGPADQASRHRASRVISSEGRVLIPGLINGHQHAPMTLFRGLGGDLDLMDWLNQYIFPAEARNVDPEFVYWGTLLSAAEMIRSGTTLYADMYYFEEEVARATARAGMRGILGQTVIGFPAPDHATPEETLESIRGFAERWKNHDLITPAVAPHAPYTCSPEVLMASRRLADELDLPVLIHLSESRDEVEQIQREQGTTPIRYLERLGFLSNRVTANHVVWADEEELGILLKNRVGVIHNPESNMKLSLGVAPVTAMLRLGLDLGLGTDGAASNNNLDLFEEMDTMAKLQKLTTSDPKVVSAREALWIATRGGARALGMDHLVGSLEPGKKADIVILHRRLPAARPAYDPYSMVVYALNGTSVESVTVGGRFVLDHGQFTRFSLPELYGRVEELKTRIRRSLGLE